MSTTPDMPADESVIQFLFSYGTLQLESVQFATFDRRLADAADGLPGFEQSLVKSEDPAGRNERQDPSSDSQVHGPRIRRCQGNSLRGHRGGTSKRGQLRGLGLHARFGDTPLGSPRLGVCRSPLCSTILAAGQKIRFRPGCRLLRRKNRVPEATFSPPLLRLKRPPPSPLAGEAGEQSGAFSGEFFIRLVALSITRQVRPQSIQE